MRAAIIFVSLLLFTAPIGAQPAKRAITIDDYFTQADIFNIAYSDRHIAYTEGRWQESTDDRKADLWIMPTSIRLNPWRLTDDRPSARSPQFGPDGETVYYLANRKREGEKRPPYDGKTQIWRVGVDGRPPSRPITQVEGGVDAYELAHPDVGTGPAAKALYYLVHVDKVEDNWSGLRSRFAKLEYGHGQNRVGQIWKLDLGTMRAEKLVDARRNIREFTVSRDGKRIAMITTPDDKVVSFEGQSRVDVWEGGKITPLPDDVYRKQMPSPYGWLEGIAWHTKSDALAFGVIFDGYPAEIVIADFRGDQTRLFKMPRPNDLHIRGYGSPLKWVPSEDKLMFLGESRGRVHLMVAGDFFGKKKPYLVRMTPNDVVVETFDGWNPQRCALVMATPSKLPDIYLGQGIKEVRQLTNVNPQVTNWTLPQLSIVSWKGAGGKDVEGILELPPDYKKGDKVPLVVEIHGGPTTATYYKLQYWIYGRTLLPARGYAVLCPNYRGSTGYGDQFTTDLIGRENNLDVEDILKGVDALVEQGIADPERLAVSGWSNGGYLTNCIITKTNRFKAAISGAGIVDAVQEWGANDEPAYTMVFKQGFPWNAAEKYHKASPTYQLDKVKTPTLIHVGANDERCPPGQSRMLYRALKEYNKTPTELIVYPGEGHGLSKMSNRRAKLEWDLAWLDRYVMGKK